jgi:hypothetical protein
MQLEAESGSDGVVSFILDVILPNLFMASPGEGPIQPGFTIGVEMSEVLLRTLTILGIAHSKSAVLCLGV